MSSPLCIGIDVGGTNTDAVLIDLEDNILAHTKQTSSVDFVSGVSNAVQILLKQPASLPTTVDSSPDSSISSRVVALMLGCTTFLNAVLQQSDLLCPVTILRICGPLTHSFPPCTSGFPEGLRHTVFPTTTNEDGSVSNRYYTVGGGLEYDGQDVSRFDESEVRSVVRKIIAESSKEHACSIVVTGINSPLFPEQELAVSQVIDEEFKIANLPYFVTKSHKVGSSGFIERENAAVLNACLLPFARQIVRRLCAAIKTFNLPKLNSRNVFFTQNDGTLITLQEVAAYPIFTFNAGPINSLRGAFRLTKAPNAFVCDIGGTSTDLAVLQKGFPRESSTYAELAGVRTNFRAADTVSIALGGGSIILVGENDGDIKVGPESVGHMLKQKAQCFGGETLTATDIAVVLGAQIEGADASLVKIDRETAGRVQQEFVRRIQIVIDNMKTSAANVPLVLVGGGNILLPQDKSIQFDGISTILKPERHSALANAMGAALAQISTTHIARYDPSKVDLRKVKEETRITALEKMVKRGGKEEGVEFFPEEYHLVYTKGTEVRLIMRVVGDIDWQKFDCSSSEDYVNTTNEEDCSEDSQGIDTSKSSKELKSSSTQPCSSHLDIDYLPSYSFLPPKIVTNPSTLIKEWHLSLDDIRFIGIGASLLGCGGGGSVNLGMFQAIQTLKTSKHPMCVIALQDVRDDQPCVWAAHYGAPTMMIERLASEASLSKSVSSLAKLCGFLPSEACLFPIEIGGLNSLAPFCVPHNLGVDIPVVDGDIMGRAFPELQMTLPFVHGCSCLPCVMSDDKGVQFTLNQMVGDSVKTAEEWCRNNAIKVGLDCGMAGAPLTKSNLIKYMVPNTISQCWRLGRSIINARVKKENPILAIEKQENAKCVFTGKIIEVHRSTQEGYSRGSTVLAGLDDYSGHYLCIHFQNENILANRLTSDEYKSSDQSTLMNVNKSTVLPGQYIASVPDLIALVQCETGQPILCEELRYGIRASVLVIPCHPLWREETSLRVAGPRAFHYDVDYRPVGDYRVPKSVMEEEI